MKLKTIQDLFGCLCKVVRRFQRSVRRQDSHKPTDKPQVTYLPARPLLGTGTLRLRSQDSPLEGGSALSPLLRGIHHLTRSAVLTQGPISHLSHMKQRGRTLGFLHIDNRLPLVIFLQMNGVLVHLVLQHWYRLAHGQE